MARHALLVGVQDYDNVNMTNLSCPRADVDLMAAVLTDPACSGEPYDVVSVTDPTVGDAFHAFSEFLKKVERNDVVVIYFSGHGVRDDKGNLFLCMRDSDNRDLHHTAYDVDRLSNALQGRHVRRVLIILDCCYSGAGGVKDGGMKSNLDAAQQANSDGTGIFLLASGGQAQTSNEDGDHSLYTKVLVNGLRTGAADRDNNGVICVHEIANYVEKAVPERARELGKTQEPQSSSKAASGEFVIAVNPAKAAEARRRTETEAAREWMTAGRKRLGEAVFADEVESHRLADVDTWIAAQRDAEFIDLSLPQLAALRDYGVREIGLVPFCGRWDAARAAAAAAAAQPVAEPDPEPVSLPEIAAEAAAPPPREAMAAKSPDGAAALDLDNVAADPVRIPEMGYSEASFSAGLERLRGAQANGFVSQSTVDAIEKVAASGDGHDVDGSRLAALGDYGVQAIGLREFLERWDISKDALAPEPAAEIESPTSPFEAGLNRLLEAHRNGHLSASEYFSVEHATMDSEGHGIDAARRDALIDYGAKSISLKTFRATWGTIEDAAAPEAESATAAPAQSGGTTSAKSETMEILFIVAVSVVGLAVVGYLGYLAVSWMWSAVPGWGGRVASVEMQAELTELRAASPYANWALGYKILVVVGAGYLGLILLYALTYLPVRLFFDEYDAPGVAIGVFAVILIGLAIYVLLIADNPISAQFEWVFLRVMVLGDAVVGLFTSSPAPAQ